MCAGVVQNEQPLPGLGEMPDLYRGAAAVTSYPALQRTDKVVAAEPLEQKILLPGLRGFGAAVCDIQPPDLRGGEKAVFADNGVCTMIDNLDFTITTGMVLTPDTTNVTTTRTLGTVGSLTSGNSYDEMRILHSSTSGYGTYYNYAAATAGTITGSSNTTEATQDICPKGWRLPAGGNTSTGYEQKLLTNNVFQTWQSIGTFDDSFKVAAGYYYGGSLSNSGTDGYWWSSTASNTTDRYFLYYNTSNGLRSGIYYNRYNGFSVRCVLK